MASEDMVDASHLAHSSIERVDGGAGHPEGDVNAFLLEHLDSSFSCGHTNPIDSSREDFYFWKKFLLIIVTRKYPSYDSSLGIISGSENPSQRVTRSAIGYSSQLLPSPPRSTTRNSPSRSSTDWMACQVPAR